MNRKKIENTPLFPQSYWVFGADLSLKRPGFCRFFVDKTSGEPVITDLETASVDNKLERNKTHGQELDEIFFGLGAFRPQKDMEKEKQFPVYYVREKGIHLTRSKNTEGAIYEVVGVSNLWLWQYKKEWFEINPQTVKRIITGDKIADKNVVAEHLKLYVGDHAYANDDESDATAVAIAFLIQNGELKSKLPKPETKRKGKDKNEENKPCGQGAA